MGKGSIGIDLGTKTAAAVSDGTDGDFIENPRWFKTILPKIKSELKNKRRKRAPNKTQKAKASRRWKNSQKKIAKLLEKQLIQELTGFTTFRRR